MRRFSSLALIACLSLGLISCRSLVDPSFMPAGYTHHGDTYKAPPGPKAKNIGYDYSAAENDEMLAIWRGAVADLVDQLESQSGLSPQGIYVHDSLARNAFNTSYDHVIREELRARGYVLENHASAAPLQLWYEAHVPVEVSATAKPEPITYNGGQAVRDHNPKTKAPVLRPNEDFVLILNLARDDTLFGKAAGVYELPSHGYEAVNPLSAALTQSGAAQ